MSFTVIDDTVFRPAMNPSRKIKSHVIITIIVLKHDEIQSKRQHDTYYSNNVLKHNN